MQRTRRDQQGRFTPGNAGGPGRPPRKLEDQYLDTLQDSCTVEDWREIVLRAVENAKRGDAKAREWLSRFLLGEPATLHAHAHLHQEAERNPFANADPEIVLQAKSALLAAQQSAKSKAERITDADG